MNKKIALFTTVNKNYVSYAERCFQLFEDSNPGIFDFYIVTSDKEITSTTSNVIILNPKDYINGSPEWGWPPESFLYFAVPNILHTKGYKYSMYIDADCVSLKKLDFNWLNDKFILAGSPRMRNDLSEEIDAWYFLNQIGKSSENINFLESSFDLQNKNNIIDINSGVIVFNNKRWVSEKLYNKAYSLFNICKENDYPMTDDDSLLTLLLLDTPKEFYKHLSLDWNWYYERPEVKSMGGDNVNILHMAWLKPWADDIHNKNYILTNGKKVWDGYKKEDWRSATKDWGFMNC
tara:strand:+ start:62 stop:934 length:873 start_codon:yes stop_codon:yes gene_type:complete